jgi:hypothetical protein
LNYKRRPSQEEHKTIFNGLKINEMAVSDRIDFPSPLTGISSIPEYDKFAAAFPE